MKISRLYSTFTIQTQKYNSRSLAGCKHAVMAENDVKFYVPWLVMSVGGSYLS